MTATTDAKTTGVETSVVPKINMQPCKDCKDRHRACHATCEKYIALQQYNVKKNAALRAEKIKAYDDFKTFGRVSATKKRK